MAQHQDLEIIELQRGAWLSEDDIERLADDFGRCGGE
jgi:mannose-6-phosphate isomerase-like protein (cupin superfamily)